MQTDVIIGAGGETWDGVFDAGLALLVTFAQLALSIGIALLWLAAFVGLFLLVHFLFSLPMRRAERARLFLDLLEDALKRGQPVEEMILSIAQHQDRTVGVRFHLLAAHIENELRFGEALKKVPQFLPPQITAMLLAGEKLGDLKKVLPACREILRERPAGVRSAMHYMLLVVLFFSPVFIGVIILITVFVIPKFKEVAAGMGVPIWPLTRFVFDLMGSCALIYIEIGLSLILLMLTVIYIGGPCWTRWFPLAGRIAWRIPWKQKRLQRTFSAMLAVLLDGGVPEIEAVRLAGDCTANPIAQKRARQVMTALQQGTRLDEAMRTFGDGEFHWRLANVIHSRGGFLRALKGWHQALDAKAFQQEEGTAHIITSGLVILNGLFVALIATAMYGVIIVILKGALEAS